jgi:chemotaxis methyl-accepting protein methylase
VGRGRLLQLGPVIVGIGASAGGLDALERFLSHVPVGSGLAFVVIQHLDPGREGMMPALLRRVSPMVVVEASDGLAVAPDSVYVIPPNKDMSVRDGVLHLLPPAEPRGLRLPIDSFFASLAFDQGDRAVGVVLSGMGSDGTLGVGAIKAKGGLAFAQAPSSAQFSSMPQSAAETGLVDVVAPAEELPLHVVELCRIPRPGFVHPPLEARVVGDVGEVVALLRERTGNDFSHYKLSTVHRRIERRMAVHQIREIGQYAQFLRSNSQELDRLFKELLVGVTRFFRDPEVWEQLIDVAIPQLLARATSNPLRAWVPGCSTGEEAYSLAIAFSEAQRRLGVAEPRPVQIFATDLDADAVAVARAGHFPETVSGDIFSGGLDRYFHFAAGHYQIRPSIREEIVFAVHNVLMDPPFTRLDFLTCRNLLIYVTPEQQKKLLHRFHYSLRPGGLMLLGSAESVGGSEELFAPVLRKEKLFVPRETVRALSVSSFSVPPAVPSAPIVRGTMDQRPLEFEVLAQQLVLEQFSPAAILVNGEGDILFTTARTGKFLEPAVGKANLNVFAMAREGLRLALALVFQNALKEGKACVSRGVTVGTNGGSCRLELTVLPLTSPVPLAGTFLIVFTELPPDPQAAKARPGRSLKAGPAQDQRMEELEAEAGRLSDELLRLRGEMQSSQEELRSANEELQSANEELQSANEELTTSKEEMQSLNEELQTVNAELQAKVDELSQVGSDLTNLLNSTDIATIFLDRWLNVRRYTKKATHVVRLIPGDIGRPLSDLVADLDYPDLGDDALGVLESLVTSEKRIASGSGGTYRVRIMPYRTLEDVIDGVVITFIEVCPERGTEAAL